MTDIITGDRLILAIANMSFNGTLIILIVLALRFLMLKTMKDLPRKYLVWLWAIPFFRLLCPLDLSQWLGKLSLIPWNSQPIAVVNHRGMAGAPYQGVRPQVDTGFVPVDQWLNDAVVQSLPAPTDLSSIDPFQITQFLLFLVWAIGATALLLLTVWNWWKLRRTVSEATLYRGPDCGDAFAPDVATQIRARGIQIYETDRISTAFVVGWIRYKIYLPTGLSAEEVNCVLQHEFAHIRRNDPLWKLLAYVAVILHWFNPVVWLAYKTLIRDIEMACDERAIQTADPKTYTSALLKLSMRGSGLLTPLAFGEGSIKERIVNALKVKEPKKAIRVAAVVLICIAAVACASNQEPEEPILLGEGEQHFLVIEGNEIFWETAGFIDAEIDLARRLREHRTSNVKDPAKMMNMVQELDWGAGIELTKANFQTNAHPYEIQLWLGLKEGQDPAKTVIDQAKLAMNSWLLLSQTEAIDAVAVTVSVETTEDGVDGAYYQVICDRETIEAANVEALTHIASVAMDRSLHPDGLSFRGEATLWDLGGDTETMLLLIRSLNVARGVVEDELFGSAKDPGVAMLLPSLPVLPVTDVDGTMSELATAATQKLITYIETLPHEISQHELREQGFVTRVLGILSDNRNRFDFFMKSHCEEFPQDELCGYPLFDQSGTGLGFEMDDFLWSEAENGEAVVTGELIPNGGGLGDNVLLYATATKEGDWILYGIMAYEDGFVMIRDISRDEFRDPSQAEYSVRMFDYLIYKESHPETHPNGTMYADYVILLTDEGRDEFTYEEIPEHGWELYSGYRPVI